jgi:hypothetical protein
MKTKVLVAVPVSENRFPEKCTLNTTCDISIPVTVICEEGSGYSYSAIYDFDNRIWRDRLSEKRIMGVTHWYEEKEVIIIDPTVSKEGDILKNESVRFANWLNKHFDPFSISEGWQNKDEEDPFIPVVNGHDVFTTEELYQQFKNRE